MRRQQGRPDRKGNLKTLCPNCQGDYLHVLEAQKMIDGKQRRRGVGLYCPLCGYSIITVYGK